MNQSGADYSNSPSLLNTSCPAPSYYSHYLKNSRSPSRSPSKANPDSPNDSMMDSSFYTKANDKSVDFLLNEPLDSSRRTSINTTYMSPMPMLLSPIPNEGPIVMTKGGRQIKMLNTSKMLMNPLSDISETEKQSVEIIQNPTPQKSETEAKQRRTRAISFGIEITNVDQTPSKVKAPTPTRVFQNLMREDIERKPQPGYKRNMDMQNLQIKALPSFRSNTDSLTRPYPVLHKGQSIGFENNSNTRDRPDVQNNVGSARGQPMTNTQNSGNGANSPTRQRSGTRDRTGDLERSSSQISNGLQEMNSMEEDSPEVQEKKRVLKQILSKIALYKIRRALAVCISIFIAGWLLDPLIEGTTTSHRSIFALIYSFLGYYLLENIVRAATKDIIPWKKVENIFDAVDILVLLVFTMAVDLKLYKYSLTTKYIFFVPLFSVIAYFCKSKAPRALKESQTAIRSLFAIQIVLIAGKIDGDLDWPWRAVLSFVWLYFGLIGVYCIVVGITLIGIIIFTLLKLRMYQNIQKATQILGFLWSTLYSGIGIVLFFALIGVTNTYDNDKDKDDDKDKVLVRDTTFLTQAIDAAQYMSLCVAVLTLLFYRWVMDFLVKFNLDEPDYKAQLGLRSNDSNRARVTRERKDTYLLKLSSTYFSFLHKGFAIKAQDLKNLKRAIKKAKGRKLNLKSGDDKKPQQSHRKNAVSARDKPYMSKETLKKEKQSLDAVFGKQNSQVEIVMGMMEIRNATKQKRRFSLNNLRSSHNVVSVLTRKETILSNDYENSGKVCLSEGDRDYAGTPMRRGMTINTRERENHCYICCDKPPNAVMVECGHGGVCVDCAVETIQTRGVCMECRMEVKKIIKIDVDPKFKDIIKGYETITVKPARRRERDGDRE